MTPFYINGEKMCWTMRFNSGRLYFELLNMTREELKAKAALYAKVLTKMVVTKTHYFHGGCHTVLRGDTAKGSVYLENATLIDMIWDIKIGEHNAGAGI